MKVDFGLPKLVAIALFALCAIVFFTSGATPDLKMRRSGAGRRRVRARD